MGPFALSVSDWLQDLLDYNIKLHQESLLEKYMKISEKQFQLGSSPKKKFSNRKLREKPASKKRVWV
ncbi:hypothetical protein OXX80_005123 [Metschnikowia pulcherrima]